jgi:prephenate dehydrogenase
MWHDICLANRDALLAILGEFRDDLARLADAIERGDGDYLKQCFERAKQARDAYAKNND